jgi:hypothetical protein
MDFFFFLLDIVKDKVYIKNDGNVYQLWEYVEEAFYNFHERQLFKKVMDSFKTVRKQRNNEIFQ